VPDTVRHKADQVIFESYLELGYNYRLTDVQAAIGREQLKRLPEMVTRRRKQVQRYRELLSSRPGLGFPLEPEWARSNWQSFCIRLPDGCNQRHVMQTLLEAGVATRRGIMCAHREPAYARQPWSCGEGHGSCDCAPSTCKRLRESEKAQDRTIILPLFHQMSDAEQDRVVAALREVCSG
jgi:perosamine synthetase